MNQARLAGGDTPHGDQGRDDETEHLGVHAVQTVTDLAAPEGPPLLLADVAIPGKGAVDGTCLDLLQHARLVHGGLLHFNLLVLFYSRRSSSWPGAHFWALGPQASNEKKWVSGIRKI
ncbi:hypothetical protein D9M71_440370 [compost metagenome]